MATQQNDSKSAQNNLKPTDLNAKSRHINSPQNKTSKNDSIRHPENISTIRPGGRTKCSAPILAAKVKALCCLLVEKQSHFFCTRRESTGECSRQWKIRSHSLVCCHLRAATQQLRGEAACLIIMIRATLKSLINGLLRTHRVTWHHTAQNWVISPDVAWQRPTKANSYNPSRRRGTAAYSKILHKLPHFTIPPFLKLGRRTGQF